VDIYIFLIIVGLGYSKIKNLKNGASSILLSLGDLKNRLCLDLKNPKKDDYEVGVKVRD
jgi:hypothetical protein